MIEGDQILTLWSWVRILSTVSQSILAFSDLIQNWPTYALWEAGALTIANSSPIYITSYCRRHHQFAILIQSRRNQEISAVNWVNIVVIKNMMQHHFRGEIFWKDSVSSFETNICDNIFLTSDDIPLLALPVLKLENFFLSSVNWELTFTETNELPLLKH